MNNNDIQKLSDREHILKRPGMYVGSTSLESVTEFVNINNKIQETEFKVVPALLKIINEIIDNSIDVAIKTNFKYSNIININIDKEKVIVEDNGTGIPVKKSGEDYMPKLAWGEAKSGSNFGDDSSRTSIGMNGVGSFCTNVFSKKFIGVTDDGNKHYKIVFENNAETFKENISESKKQGTKVEFYPDLKLLGLTEITEEHIKVIEQRLINLSLSFPDIKFKFNGKNLNVKKFKDYAKLFDENVEIYESDNIKFAITTSENHGGDFKQLSFVNGLKIPDGGIHIDQVIGNISNTIRDKLIKKYKSIKPSDVKNKLMIIMFITNFPNPKFNSQTKEKLVNTIGEFNSFANIDYSFINKIIKNNNIIEPIINVHKAKEFLESQNALKQIKKVKKIKSDKFFKATKSEKYLCICEGQSAFGGISKILGNSDFSYYLLKGKPLNSYEISNQKLAGNQELSELYQIIRNNTIINDLPDGKYFEVTINNKKYIVNENDMITIDGKEYEVSKLIK